MAKNFSQGEDRGESNNGFPVSDSSLYRYTRFRIVGAYYICITGERKRERWGNKIFNQAEKGEVKERKREGWVVGR